MNLTINCSAGGALHSLCDGTGYYPQMAYITTSEKRLAFLCACSCHLDYDPLDEQPVSWRDDPDPDARGRKENQVYRDLRESWYEAP